MRSQYGINWRAAVVMIAVLGPLLPGLAYAVSPTTVSVPAGVNNLYSISWLYGFHVAILLFWGLNYLFPAPEALVAATIPGVSDEIEGIEPSDQALPSSSNSIEQKTASVEEKGV
jgi:nucleobase:cation symporter-1, NCS1 family